MLFLYVFYRFLVSQGPPWGSLGPPLGGLGGLLLGRISVSGAGWASGVSRGPQKGDLGVDFGIIFDQSGIDFGTILIDFRECVVLVLTCFWIDGRGCVSKSPICFEVFLWSFWGRCWYDF